MPRGDKSAYSGKQKRKAEHIEESYEESGVPKEEAERRAWATVNKQDGGAKAGPKAKHPAKKRPTAKRATAKKSAAGKSTARKSTVKKTIARKSTAKRAVAKKAASRR